MEIVLVLFNEIRDQFGIIVINNVLQQSPLYEMLMQQRKN